MHKNTNALANESSPYLLQHANNPVNWVPWSQEAFDQAKKENKLVLVSIGYSSCHWCHVMERECFENEEVAKLMNDHFVNIKVDREEHPDVDQIYMTAVQLMTQKGGWPLNCFTLPDGKPVYGGTYFPKDQWMHILRSLEHTYRTDRERAIEYAEKLSEGVELSELITKPVLDVKFEEERLHEMVLRWSRNFDKIEGGGTRAPKFPMPNNYEFLLRYGVQYESDKVLSHVELTLDKMAAGGIYDQIGGGFYRYSVDMIWKVPHFEKMLYDNAQLLSLYAQAYQVFKKDTYARVIDETVEWLNREMKSKEGAFFSAIDADSEEEEGKFYCWEEDELKQILGGDFSWFKEYYGINQKGYWEDGKYILTETVSETLFAKKMSWSLEEMRSRISSVKDNLLNERKRRIRPGLDFKCITSWNAMLVSGLCDAYRALQNVEFKLIARKIVLWIQDNQLNNEGHLFRIRTNGQTSIKGVLEDYAMVIQAYLDYFEISGEEVWVYRAEELRKVVNSEFRDEQSTMFFFTSSDSPLVVRKMELNDNVIPSSNSVMARNLFRLSQFLHKNELKEDASQMLANVYEGMEQYGSGYSNWGNCLMELTNECYQVVIMEDKHQRVSDQLLKHYLPQVVFAISDSEENELPVFEYKSGQKLPQISVCYEGTCLLPTSDPEEALLLIRKGH